MARLFVSLGHKTEISKSDIMDAFNDGGMSQKEIGDVAVYSRFSFVEVPKKDAEKVINKMSGSKEIKGQKMFIEYAKQPLS